jgi:predicted alpha/beta-hydrolase family hydrolase
VEDGHRSFRIDLTGGGTVGARHYAPGGAPAHITLVLAHGAGSPQTHPFMVAFATGLAARGLDVVTFNFPYMEARRRMPDSRPALERGYLDAIAAARAVAGAGARGLFIGGKSMGGRIASHVAAARATESGALAGLAFLGYPLHPPGRPEQRRDEHLPAVAPPMLFVQGTRDTFGTPDELRSVISTIGPRAELFVVEHGDHSFAVPRSAPASRVEVYAQIQDVIADWTRRIAGKGDT